MAKTLKQLQNGIRVNYLIKEKKYFLFFGSQQCTINNNYQDGFNTQQDAEIYGNDCRVYGYRLFID